MVSIEMDFPTHKQLADINYAPEGEYVKDHSFVYHDGLFHMFSISGPLGCGWHDKGGEETFSHSTSKDLIHWEFRNHVLSPGKPGDLDQDKIWAPFVIEHDKKFYMFYSGVTHSFFDEIKMWQNHQVRMCLAVSEDLFHWEKITSTQPICDEWGQDPHVMKDEETGLFYLYSMGGDGIVVRKSEDLLNWSSSESCLCCNGYETIPWATTFPSESPFVLKHNGLYYLMLNDAYSVSTNPCKFDVIKPNRTRLPGFAGEIIKIGERYIRTGISGNNNYFRLRMMEIAFIDGEITTKIVKPEKTTEID